MARNGLARPTLEQNRAAEEARDHPSSRSWVVIFRLHEEEEEVEELLVGTSAKNDSN